VSGYIAALIRTVKTIIAIPGLLKRYFETTMRTFIIGFKIINSQIAPISKRAYLTSQR
jgi:hypothetical protein